MNPLPQETGLPALYLDASLVLQRKQNGYAHGFLSHFELKARCLHLMFVKILTNYWRIGDLIFLFSAGI